MLFMFPGKFQTICPFEKTKQS